MLKSTVDRAAGSSPWRRLGKIKLGIKVEKKNEQGVVTSSYPKDVDYFVLPEQFHKTLGEKPKELAICLAFQTLKQNFDTRAAMYKANGARACWTNDDVTAHRYMKPEGSDRYQWVDMVCPNVECEFRKNKKCPERGGFSFMIPATGQVGTFYLQTGSKVAIDRILAALESLEALTQNRPQGMMGLRMVLRRELTVFNVDVKGDGVQTRIEKYIPTLDIDWAQLLASDKALLAPFTGQALAALPPVQVQADDLVEHDDEEDEPKDEVKP